MKRTIPEEFVGSTDGAIEHRVVLSVCWGNSWQLWLEREEDDVCMIEKIWNEFVDDNHFGPNDNLFFRHDDTMFLEVQIFKNNGEEIIDYVEPETEPLHPKPENSHKKKTTASASGRTDGRVRCDRDVNHPKQYLVDPKNPFFVQSLLQDNKLLYVRRAIFDEHRHGMKFGPAGSPVTYLLPGGKEAVGKVKYRSGQPVFTGWGDLCKKYNLKIGDSVVYEFESSGGLFTAVRVHFINED